jgi:hypothetical protein
MIPDKIHSTIEIDVDNSCNNCCCFPRTQRRRGHVKVRRQPTAAHLQAIQDKELAQGADLSKHKITTTPTSDVGKMLAEQESKRIFKEMNPE